MARLMKKFKFKASTVLYVIAVLSLVNAGVCIYLCNYSGALYNVGYSLLQFILGANCANYEQLYRCYKLTDDYAERTKKIAQDAIKELKEAKEVLTATIIERDNANAEIAKLKQEIEQLKQAKVKLWPTDKNA